MFNITKINPLSGVGALELIGIDFNTNYLKLAYVRGLHNRKEVINLASQNISGLTDADIARALEISIVKLKAKRPLLIDMISPASIITKNVEVPSTSPAEIREIINLQACRHTPYSREEIIVDYIDIGTYKRNYTKILLVIVARTVVKKHMEILNRAGLSVERLVFASEGLALSAPYMLKTPAADSPASIIHIDEAVTEFIVVYRGKPLFIRSIPIGVSHLVSEKEKYQMRFTEELKRSLEAYHSEDIEKVPNILLLTGATHEISDLERVLNDTLHIPVRVMPYLRNVSVSNEALKAQEGAPRVSFLNIIGPLMSWEETKVDLTPEEIKLKKSVEERGRELITTGILTLTICVLLFSILLSKIYFRTVYLRQLTDKYKWLDEETKSLEKDFTKLSFVRSYLARRGYSIEVLSELYRFVPEDIEFNNLRFAAQDKFSISGTAGSMSTVFSFVDNMKKSRYFKDVTTRYTTKRKDGTRDVADFEIVATLSKDVK